METIDFAEAEAAENARFHIESAETLAKEANTLVAVLFAGASLLLGFFIADTSSFTPSWQVWGILASSAYMFLIGGLASLKCLWARRLWPPANEPEHLMQDDFDALAIRRVCLKNKQNCIDLNKARNDTVGFWLNTFRLLTAATPVVFLAGALTGGHWA